MAELLHKNFAQPDEAIDSPLLTGQVVALGELYVGKYIHRPGWRWSKDVQPAAGTRSCQYHHQGLILSGALHVVTDDGASRTLLTGDVFDIPPGHDAWVVGDEPAVSVEFRGARDWAKPRTDSERLLTTLLFTDIVGSTGHAARLGDAAWNTVLVRHYDRVRLELDRYRGYEVKTTGDGFLAMFDSTARAAHCADSICRAARADGLEVRAGIHTGEIQRFTDSVQGVAVHVAARIMAQAGGGEVLLSASTAELLEGSGIKLADAGDHELKGLEGKRRLFRFVAA